MAKKKVSEMPPVGDINNFLVFGVDVATNQNAKATMLQLKGNSGDSAYQLWLKQPGNAGKSYAEYELFNRQPALDAANSANQQMGQISISTDQAITNANNAANEAKGAASNANQAATGVGDATRAANAAAESANSAATEAYAARDGANEAATKANNAGERVEQSLEKVDTATTKALQSSVKADSSAEAAENATEISKELNDHPMQIINGVWWKWDIETKDYINTNIEARGKPGVPFQPLDQFETFEELVASIPDGTGLLGMMQVGIEEPFEYYAWVAKDGVYAWRTQGKLQGAPGKSPRINENDVWEVYDNITNEWIDTGIKAHGADGKTPVIGENGNWWIGYTDTGVTAIGKDWKVIDIDHVPDENDINYQDETGTHPYPIGITIRNKNEEQITFYKLYDIVDEKADWRIEGSGGASEILNFTEVLRSGSWTEDEGKFKYEVDNIFVEDPVYVSVVIKNNSTKTASDAGVLPHISGLNGKFIIYSNKRPGADINIDYALIRNGGSGTGGTQIQYEAAPGGGLVVVNGNQFSIDPDYRRVKHKSVIMEPSKWTQEIEGGLWMARIPAEGVDEDLKDDCLVLCGSDESTLPVWEEAQGITSIMDVDSGFFYATCKKQPTGNILYKYSISL